MSPVIMKSGTRQARVIVMNGVAVIRDMVPHNLYLVTFVLGS